MLSIKTPDELATLMGIRTRYLFWLLDNINRMVDVFALISPSKPLKPRYVTSARPQLRAVQRLFYAQVLLPRLERSPHSHGGVPERSAKTNAAEHQGQSFVFTTDIVRFFPSIHHERVRNLFLMLGCSVKVAGLCTRLVTHDMRLAQGFCTSPILADQLLRTVDAEIANACSELGLIYTRFVDDITISGGFDFGRSNIPDTIRRIIRCQGFRINEGKEQQETSLADGKATITNVRVFNGRLDATASYVNELERQLKDHACLGEGKAFDGPYCTQDHLWGKIEYVCSLNPNRRKYLYGLLRGIDWDKVREMAAQRNFVVPVKVLKHRVLKTPK